MRKIIATLSIAMLSVLVNAQSPLGAWEGYSSTSDTEKTKHIVIFSDGYYTVTSYNAKTGAFMSTNGGAWQLTTDTIAKTIEFDTEKPERIGTKESFKINATDSTLHILGTKMNLNRVDSGMPGKLKGAWLMSGRVRDGKKQLRDTSRPRKTMKILSGTRFQWIAYNTETKQFSGTGGGTYTTVNGVYTENIEFFSKDDSRVGASLKFNYELVDRKWQHTGFSSKGKPIHEIWSLRN